jgi:starch phosphorylase
MPGTRFSLEVQPKIPVELKRLEELANDLFYSWDRQVRRLFTRLDQDLWGDCGHNPKMFLRRISQEDLEAAVDDRVFMEDYQRVLSAYDSYQHQKIHPGIDQYLDPKTDLIAYFCAEFGFHESLPIYSGGLGILAGDHCKAASDLCIPFVAVGMLYRQGYFTQTIDKHGNQIAHYTPTDFNQLPLGPALDPHGAPLQVHVDFPGRKVTLKVWLAKAGHISLYLLDSDLEENRAEDRVITYQLYGGDTNTRIQQEIVLGIGGVRALRALGMKPTIWHINEGHAAFMVLERVRERVSKGMDFASALELVAAGTVFTTHTPVAAGHDIFSHELVGMYFSDYVRELGIEMPRFLALGTSPHNDKGFNQTALALRGSRFHNGVSRVHGGVASEMESYIWPQIPAEENPMRHVTNGVHLQTFLARDWANLYDMRFGRDWTAELLNEEYWECVDRIPDHSFWSLHQSLKTDLFSNVWERAMTQHRRNGCGETLARRLTQYLTPHDNDILTIGFARRFATYKRAALLFADPARLERLLGDPASPVLFIFAGKAHPHDLPGQQLVQLIHEFSLKPEFIGKIILLEGYDMSLARRLVTGVDVWLNTPEFPMEASGTSGQKAAMNGVINLSVLDGWWAEGFNGENGWAITPHDPYIDEAYRNHEESNELLDILETEVIPVYYDRNGHGYSERWVSMSKASMKSALPKFNSQRMLRDYIRDFYAPASRQHRLLGERADAGARELAAWKAKVAAIWPEVRLRLIDTPNKAIAAGTSLPIRVAASLEGLAPEDVTLECVVGTQGIHGELVAHEYIPFRAARTDGKGDTLFELDLRPPLSGLQHYQIRMYPHHRLLSHPFETGRMIWI